LQVTCAVYECTNFLATLDRENDGPEALAEPSGPELRPDVRGFRNANEAAATLDIGKTRDNDKLCCRLA